MRRFEPPRLTKSHTYERSGVISHGIGILKTPRRGKKFTKKGISITPSPAAYSGTRFA